MVFKKHLTAPKVGGSAKGQIVKQAGKGSSAGNMASRSTVKGLSRPPGNTLNDYTKAAPSASPSQDPSGQGSYGMLGGVGAGTGA